MAHTLITYFVYAQGEAREWSLGTRLVKDKGYKCLYSLSDDPLQLVV